MSNMIEYTMTDTALEAVQTWLKGDAADKMLVSGWDVIHGVLVPTFGADRYPITSSETYRKVADLMRHLGWSTKRTYQGMAYSRPHTLGSTCPHHLEALMEHIIATRAQKANDAGDPDLRHVVLDENNYHVFAHVPAFEGEGLSVLEKAQVNHPEVQILQGPHDVWETLEISVTES